MADQVELSLGPVAQTEFDSSPEWAKREIAEWLPVLRSMTDADFLDETAFRIYESANMGRFKGNWNHVHVRATICFDESRTRLVEAGHDKDCHGPSLYSRAHARVMLENNYDPTPEGTCRCESIADRRETAREVMEDRTRDAAGLE